MIKTCLIISILFIYSCNTKNSLESRKWDNLDTTRGLSYNVNEKGNGEKGDISIKYWGRIENDEYIKDTVTELLYPLENLIISVIGNSNVIKEMPTGTTGFIRVNVAGFFEGSLSEIKHYILYFTGKLSNKALKEDSVKLESLGVFKTIDIISSEKAMDQFSKDNEDVHWKEFINSNPLPASIELTLKKEFIKTEKYDSIKNIIAKLMPVAEIQMPFSKSLWGFDNELKKILVYKFVIF